MKIYIAGPMAGQPRNNYDAFFGAEERLKALGWEVVNPIRIEPQKSLEEYMAISLKQVLDADAVVLLDGWFASKGARLEAEVAQAAAIPIFRERENPTPKEAQEKQTKLIDGARRKARRVQGVQP